jgi:hypothetical protein
VLSGEPVDGTATLAGSTGVRALVRISGQRSDGREEGPVGTLDTFLGQTPDPSDQLGVMRFPVPQGTLSGQGSGTLPIRLAGIGAKGGGAADRWTISTAVLNDWGEIAGPARIAIAFDRTGPTLTLEPPSGLTAPWPFQASVPGRSEPGVLIRVGDDSPRKADDAGRFDLPANLAPWPQTLTVTAVDDAGNETVATISLVGGVDYRDWPWPAIVAVALLLGVAASAVRGSRRVRDPGVYREDDPTPEIEDLPDGGGLTGR